MDIKIDNKLIFIGGTGRSGTNILRKLLARHSKVGSLPFEYRFIIDPDGIIDFYNSFSSTWSPYYSDIKIKRLNSFLMNLSDKTIDSTNYEDWELSEYFPKYIENVKKLIMDLKCFEYSGTWPGADRNIEEYKIWFSEYKSKKSLKNLLSRFVNKNINSYLKKHNKECFIEDNTWNILFTKELLELFPTSRLLHMVRDPRDVVASFLKQSWCPHNINHAIQMYKTIIKRWFQIEKKIPNSSFKLIKLENLVLEKTETINSICEYINMPFEKELENIDLSRHNSDRWKKELSNENKILLNTELEEVINKFGYNF